MDVKLNKLYETFLLAQDVGFDYGLTFSLRSSPKLKEFLADLDPEMSLDWSGKSFYGLPQLRQRVIETQGYNVPVENVMICAGTNEANLLIITQTVSAGDEVVIDRPSWPQAYALCEAYGARIKIINRREELGWNIDLDELDRMVTPKTKLIFLNCPNNPTGHVFSESDMKAICDIARKNGSYFLCDEVYRGLEWDGPRAPAAVNYYEKAISAASVSKCCGLQGIRTGWLATRDKDLLFKCLVLREDASEVMNTPGEYIALAALKPSKYKELLDGAKEEGRRCWPLIEEWIAGHKGFHWVKPQAGFLCFVRFDLKLSSEEFSRRLLAPPYRTLILPGAAYGLDNYIRLGVGGGNVEEIRGGLAQLERFVSDVRREG
jgi:aspartate/methionine/tyrosine aminotransferase